MKWLALVFFISCIFVVSTFAFLVYVQNTLQIEPVAVYSARDDIIPAPQFELPIQTIKKPLIDTPVVDQKQEKPKTMAVPPTIPKPPPPPPQEFIPDADIYNRGLVQTVNLLCDIGHGEFIVATGALIDPKGIIISNAHVALDTNSDKPCTIRHGAQAESFAKATLLFVPTSYKKATSSEDQARVDFALWRITEPAASGAYLYWEIDFQKQYTPNELLYTLSYPAELLGGETIFKSLGLLFSSTHIVATNTYIVRTTANVAAQKGSSGGILIDPYTAKMRGLIFGVSDEKTITDREMYALSPKAINEVMKNETGNTLIEYLAGM